jgi:hypothetical protein
LRRQLHLERNQYAIEIGHHIDVGHPKRGEAEFALQLSVAPRIQVRIVGVAVHFDNQRPSGAEEIDNPAAEDYLASEFEAPKPTVP